MAARSRTVLRLALDLADDTEKPVRYNRTRSGPTGTVRLGRRLVRAVPGVA